MFSLKHSVHIPLGLITARGINNEKDFTLFERNLSKLLKIKKLLKITSVRQQSEASNIYEVKEKTRL